MDHCKKMILIEPEVMERLKKEPMNDTTTSRLDAEMQNILKTKLDDREKWSLYLQVLQRYLHFIERKPIHLPIVNQVVNDVINNDLKEYKTDDTINMKLVKESSPERDVENKRDNLFQNTTYLSSHLLRSIPKTYRNKGEFIVEKLLKNPDKITWDKDGVVYIDKKEITGSNIKDLIHDTLRPLRRIDEPIGWETFIHCLKDLKVPHSYIGNPKRSIFMKNLYHTELKPIEVDLKKYNTTPKRKGEYKSKTSIDWEKWTPY